MSNPVAAGRQLAQRATILQVGATLATALICLISGPSAALGALVGGGSMALGNGIAALRTFSGGVVSGEAWLGRLLAGMAMKWIVVVMGLYLAMTTWKLPPPAVLAGAAMAATGYLLAARQWNRGRLRES